jgi:hypothetical protein
MIYPLSRGLLVSMALRCSHDFALNRPTDAPAFTSGFNEQERESLLIKMHALYLRFLAGYEPAPGTGGDAQICEECTGKGFFAPEREAGYADHWPKEFKPDWF